jgi:hypothetical protein
MLQELDSKVADRVLGEDFGLKNYLDGVFDDRGFMRMVNAGHAHLDEAGFDGGVD